MERRTRQSAWKPGRLLTLMLAGATTFSIAGCKQLILLMYLIGGPPSIEPEFDKQTGKSLTDYGVLVAVVCYADEDILWTFDKVDYQIASGVSRKLAMHEIHTIPTDRVRAWLDQNPDWDRPQEIGAGLTDADGRHPTHIIYIDLMDYGLYEKDSHNLFRGRAEATVSVFEMDETGDGGQKIFSDEIKSQYPIHAAESTLNVPYGNFRNRYLTRLSEEVGRLFYERYAGDDIPDGA